MELNWPDARQFVDVAIGDSYTFAMAEAISLVLDALRQLLLSLTTNDTVNGPDVAAGFVSTMALPPLTLIDAAEMVGATEFTANHDDDPSNVDVATTPKLFATKTYAG